VHGSDTAGELVAATGLTFGYGRVPVIDDVDLTVRRGEFVALVGPNGSGKTTLLRLILGTLEPQAGEVRLFGSPPREARGRGELGYVPQRPNLSSEVPVSVREIVESGRLGRGRWWRRLRPADRAAVEHAVASVGLRDLIDRPSHELSGGQLQRAFIARAFAGEPSLLVLDEPIAGVDAASQRLFRDSLRHLIDEHGAGVLLVSHELSAVADDVDRVIVLKGRVLFDGPPADLRARGVGNLGVHAEDLPFWLEELA
jgi:zinc transport system ATP-binding protein